jgi:hypothetical protein
VGGAGIFSFAIDAAGVAAVATGDDPLLQWLIARQALASFAAE